MNVYRVFVSDTSAPPGDSGHPDFLFKPQGKNRIDNPHLYDAWYFATTPEGAVGEVFGDIPVWSEDMFETPFLPTGRRALGTFRIPDDIPVLDLDDAQHLVERALRPTQIIARNRPTTQAWAARIFEETNDDGSRRWAGVRWWSYQRPTWTIYALWVAPGTDTWHQFVKVDPLHVAHPAVVDAADSLVRTFE